MTRSKAKTQTLEEITNIEFPHAVVASEIKEIMAHICYETGSEVNYSTKVSHRIRNLDEPICSEEVVEINGSITSHSPLAILSFSASREIVDNGSRYSGLKFLTTPGYSINELPAQEVISMQEVKQCAERYFEKIRINR